MQRIAKTMPLENMLLETDAPYQSPVSGQTNEPSNLPKAAITIAKLKGITAEIVAKTTTTNALNFLRLQHVYKQK
jgi:TatD DNase family protein